MKQWKRTCLIRSGHAGGDGAGSLDLRSIVRPLLDERTKQAHDQALVRMQCYAVYCARRYAGLPF